MFIIQLVFPCKICTNVIVFVIVFNVLISTMIYRGSVIVK